MKPLEQLTNTEKAKILHGLFPKQIPALVQFIKSMSQTIREDERLRQQQLAEIFPDTAVSLAALQEVETKIDRYGDRLNNRASLFADQLFDGNAALYTIWCLRIYVTIQKHSNAKFTQAINLLFN